MKVNRVMGESELGVMKSERDEMIGKIRDLCWGRDEPEMLDELVSWVFEMCDVSWDDVQFRYVLLMFPEHRTLRDYFPEIQEQYLQVVSRLAEMYKELVLSNKRADV